LILQYCKSRTSAAVRSPETAASRVAKPNTAGTPGTLDTPVTEENSIALRKAATAETIVRDSRNKIKMVMNTLVADVTASQRQLEQ
jgi:hypothetical protein